jgi:hypothetical protein
MKHFGLAPLQISHYNANSEKKIAFSADELLNNSYFGAISDESSRQKVVCKKSALNIGGVDRVRS